MTFAAQAYAVVNIVLVLVFLFWMSVASWGRGRAARRASVKHAGEPAS